MITGLRGRDVGLCAREAKAPAIVVLPHKVPAVSV